MRNRSLAKTVTPYIVAGIVVLAAVGLQPGHETATASDSPPFESCWGQATAVFARMGEMGEHASTQPTPRAGLRNLARELYDAGVIEDDSMAALAAWINEEMELDVCACMQDGPG